MKHLTRSDNKMVAGVLAGIAEYFSLDVSLVRLVFVFFVIFTGFFPLGLFYIMAWMIIPEKHVSCETCDKDEKKNPQGGESVSHETN